MAKGRKEIKQELEQKKKEGDLSSKKALELARLAEKTKATLESMQGEATEEAAKGMESAAAAFQQTIETKAVQAEKQSEKIDTELEQTQQKFEEAKKSDQLDISKLKSLESEAKRAGIGVEGVVQAEKAKMEEIQFLASESQGVEKAQQEMQKKIQGAKHLRKRVSEIVRGGIATVEIFGGLFGVASSTPVPDGRLFGSQSQEDLVLEAGKRASSASETEVQRRGKEADTAAKVANEPTTSSPPNP